MRKNFQIISQFKFQITIIKCILHSFYFPRNWFRSISTLNYIVYTTLCSTHKKQARHPIEILLCKLSHLTLILYFTTSSRLYLCVCVCRGMLFLFRIVCIRSCARSHCQCSRTHKEEVHDQIYNHFYMCTNVCENSNHMCYTVKKINNTTNTRNKNKKQEYNKSQRRFKN